MINDMTRRSRRPEGLRPGFGKFSAPRRPEGPPPGRGLICPLEPPAGRPGRDSWRAPPLHSGPRGRERPLDITRGRRGRVGGGSRAVGRTVKGGRPAPAALGPGKGAGQGATGRSVPPEAGSGPQAPVIRQSPSGPPAERGRGPRRARPPCAVRCPGCRAGRILRAGRNGTEGPPEGAPERPAGGRVPAECLTIPDVGTEGKGRDRKWGAGRVPDLCGIPAG
jgi:hypothetical protein